MDFTNYEFDQKFDVIISAVAIHNVTHKEKSDLFKKIFNSLTDSGVFVNGDFYKHESDVFNEFLKDKYKQFLQDNLSGNELKVWLHHAFKEDMPMTLTEQYSILTDTGFKQLDLQWLFNNEVVYIARK